MRPGLRALGGLLAGLLIAPPGYAEDDTPPDGDFLEYLGLWKESDAEWIELMDMPQLDAETKQPDQAPEPAVESNDDP